MVSHLYRTLLRDKRFVVSSLWGIVVLWAGLASGLMVKPYLALIADDVLHSADLILDNVPTIYMGGLAVWGPVLLFIILLTELYLHPQYFPFTAKTIGILYLVRSCFLFLTPLGIHPARLKMTADSVWESIAYVGHDFFFSGHVSFPCLLAMIFWKHTFMRYVYLLFTVLMAATVLLEHIHYSIDVFAAPFIVFGILSFCKYFFRQDWVWVEEEASCTGD